MIHNKEPWDARANLLNIMYAYRAFQNGGITNKEFRSCTVINHLYIHFKKLHPPGIEEEIRITRSDLSTFMMTHKECKVFITKMKRVLNEKLNIKIVTKRLRGAEEPDQLIFILKICLKVL